MKIMSVDGTRTYFMKFSPLKRQIEKTSNVNNILVHTVQLYDERMSESLFKELNIHEPNIKLEICSGCHSEQVENRILLID